MQVNIILHDAAGGCLTREHDAGLPLWIGREPECEVCVQDHHVSRRHAVLSFEPECIRVRDTSSNGTLAGGRLVKADEAIIEYGSPILLGDHTLRVERSDAADAEIGDGTSEANADHPGASETVAPAKGVDRSQVHATLRRTIHEQLITRLDPAALDAQHLDDVALRPKVLTALRRIVAALKDQLPPELCTETLIAELADEALGLGPLEQLLSDPSVSEVMVVNAETIYVERSGRLELAHQRFTDEDRVRAVIERIVTPLGRRIDESSPLVDARLADGSRVNAIIRPLAIHGSCITIRKFAKTPLALSDLLGFGTLSDAMGRFLSRCVIARRNVLVAGGTGSGKTTLLNVLSSAIPNSERIVTIEDAAELRLSQPHVVSLETKQANIEGNGVYTVRDLVRNSLRMRPDRIVVGEVRGGEALDMLQAMNTGHDGSLTTTHANSPSEALARLETLALMAGLDLPARAIREQIASSLHIVVQQARLSDGSRKVIAISELCGLDPNGDFEVRCIYRFTQSGVDADGKVVGQFCATGYLPSFLSDFLVKGLIQPGEPYL
jgi:pilus assembly protein CpaF